MALLDNNPGTSRELVVYIIYYRAPIDVFAKHVDTAVEIFKTSVWRTDFDPTVNLDVVS